MRQVSYTTRYDGRAYRKIANVYLPAGYSDTPGRRYDVLYYLHGWGGNADLQLGTPGRPSAYKHLLDRLISAGPVPPMIVVAPTYYPQGRVSTSSYFDDDPLNRRFARTELTQDLIPAVEGRFRTYARSTDAAGLRSSRDHRGFGGFSMGSITTWYVFQYDLADFAWFQPQAGDSWTVESEGGGSQPQRTARALAAAARSQASASGFAATDFFIASSVGGADGTSASMEPQIQAMRQIPAVFTSRNLVYRTDPVGGHDEQSMLAQSRMTLPLLFRASR